MGAAHYLELVDQDNAPILGESEGHDFEGCIDIKGWNWDVSDESMKSAGSAKDATGKGATAGAGKASAGSGVAGVEPAPFTFTKAVDASTTRLMAAMYKGHVLKMATFTLLEELMDVSRKGRGAFRLHVVLENVKVTSYRLGGRASEHRVDLDETWELDYSKISFLYETERMNAEFDRHPGSTKRGSERPDAGFLEMLRKYGITPEPQGKGPGGRG